MKRWRVGKVFTILSLVSVSRYSRSYTALIPTSSITIIIPMHLKIIIIELPHRVRPPSSVHGSDEFPVSKDGALYPADSPILNAPDRPSPGIEQTIQ